MRAQSLALYIIPLAKLFLVPIMLWAISHNVANSAGIITSEIDPFVIIVAIIANQVALTLFAIRMRKVLDVFGIKISWLQSLKIHLQSMFYFFVLPMTVGLEAARFAKIRSTVGGDVQILALGSALLADRLIGALMALVLALVFLPFMSFMIRPQWDAHSLGVIIIGCSGLIVLMCLHRGVRAYFREAARLIYADRRGLWVALMVSTATHLSFTFGIYLAAIGSQIEITFPQALFAISAAMLFVVLPISFAGISPVEAAAVGLLLSLGIPADQALLFAAILYFAKLIAAFEGGGWELYDGGEYVSRRLLQGKKSEL
jgi:uncharacterized membrane protein YbhN (UPF0104 family)